VDAQTGKAILFKNSTSDGKVPHAVAKDILFRHNIVRNSPTALSIQGDAGINGDVAVARLRIEQNVFENIGSFNGTTGNYTFHLGIGLNIAFIGNVALDGISTSMLSMDGWVNDRLAMTGNAFQIGKYGVKGGGGTTTPLSAFQYYWPNHIVTGNTFVGTTTASAWPAGNQFVASAPLPAIAATVQEYARLARLGVAQ
jgi:hypothetical protein